ncbi:CHAP domain-containing protein [Prescottella agglutinans]|nr:CHAP domain-containing protein [Prescottella agglutinans]
MSSKSGVGRVAALGCAVVIMVVVGLVWWAPWRGGAIVGAELRSFPTVDGSALDPTRARIVDVVRTEFDAQPSGTKYSEGAEESWCADFVSWTLREVGEPLSNPNSGSWRIPGVYTLQEYYESVGRFRPVDSGYVPRTGDVALYAPSSPFGQHTNFVIDYDAGTLTTVGGNEADAIKVHRFAVADVPELLGYGVL